MIKSKQILEKLCTVQNAIYAIYINNRWSTHTFQELITAFPISYLR